MHILIIPSEEYVPVDAPLAGIFQKHQISVFKEKSDYIIGVVSIKLKFSLPMIARALLYRLLGRRVDNELNSLDIFNLLKLTANKLFNCQKYISIEHQNGVNLVKVEGLYYYPPSSGWDHISWVKAGIDAYKAYVARFGRPDLIHAHNALNAGLLAREIKKKYQVDYVLTEHSSYYYQDLIPHKLYPKINAVIRAATCYTVVSPRLKDVLLNTIGESAESAIHLPNVLPPSYEHQEITQKLKPELNENFIYLSVGNLLPVKGHDTVIRSFSHVIRKHRQVILKIVGGGPRKKELQLLAKELGVEDNVEFFGEIDPSLVRKFMLEADVFVFPSRFETFGVALIEAMACGLPVISTACGGPESVVNEETGILVRPESVSDMERGMLWAFDNVNSMPPNEIRASVISRFGGDAFFKRIQKIYLNIVKSDKAKAI